MKDLVSIKVLEEFYMSLETKEQSGGSYLTKPEHLFKFIVGGVYSAISESNDICTIFNNEQDFAINKLTLNKFVEYIYEDFAPIVMYDI